jgi:phytanoyl-CoA hydroxylase
MDTLRVRYDRDGFVVIPDFLDAATIASLRARAEAIVANAESAPRATFSASDDNAARPADGSFLTSGYAVRCFYEEGAFDATGALRVPITRAINKIGHALHDLDEVFAAFTHSEKLDVVARTLGLADPRIYQSTYIFKQPRIGGDVRCHQDATYFDTEPQTVTAFWFALDDADAENGCLAARPGTHRGPLRERFVVDAEGARLEHLDDAPWPALDTMEPIAVRAGALVIMHGLLPHASGPNATDRSRHAYIVHVVDGAARYSPRNWLQRQAVPATGFMPVR